jgi:hypothetical protein
MLQKNRGIWEQNYCQNTLAPTPEVPRSSLSVYMVNFLTLQSQQHNDDFSRYIDGRLTPWTEWKTENLSQWRIMLNATQTLLTCLSVTNGVGQVSQIGI